MNKFADGLLIGIFADRIDIENAYNASRNNRYMDSDIYLMMSEESRQKYFPSDNKYQQIVKQGTIADIIAYSSAHESTQIMSSIAAGLLLPKLGIIVTGDFGSLIKGMCQEEEELACILMLLGIDKEKARQYVKAIDNGKLLLAVKIKEQDLVFFEKNWEENYATGILYIAPEDHKK